MKKFFFKLLIVSSPALMLLALYFYNDPFKVFHPYNNYYPHHPYPSLSEEVVSTGTFISKHNNINYDSYIFGSSISMFYMIGDWQQHIHAAHCFHLDSYNESLYGIQKKVAYLKQNHLPIKNAIFVLDHNILAKVDNDTWATTAKNPRMSGDSKVAYQLAFLKQFFYSDYIKEYLYNKLTGKTFRPSAIFGDNSFIYNDTTNEYHRDWDKMIDQNADSYYVAKQNLFFERDTVQPFFPPLLGDQQRLMLSQIKAVLDEDHTDYRVVISPLYDQQKLAPADMIVLYSVFGRDRLLDLSGINDITQSKYNYYDQIHYRTSITRRIIDSLYRQQQ